MPVYEYECQDCGRTFTLVQSLAEHETAKSVCPYCQSARVERLMSSLQVVTSRKS